ncbi:replication initiator [Nocardia sp. NPDC051990]|uniref:replication initiator n=1 Tax=Nocardia sp. NPDC051990 TaxID=3155285 RepID=UPI0034276C10
MRARTTSNPPGRGPSFDEVPVETAKRFGVCIRPMVLERTDTVTGAVSHVPVPCGNTMEAVCSACALKAKVLRLAQCREGRHLDHEPEMPGARATFDQTVADVLPGRSDGDLDRSRIERLNGGRGGVTSP